MAAQRAVSATQRPDDLLRWLRFLGIEDCTCAMAWRKSLGRMYGQDMGPGWVRTTTEPDCPHHGKDA